QALEPVPRPADRTPWQTAFALPPQLQCRAWSYSKKREPRQKRGLSPSSQAAAGYCQSPRGLSPFLLAAKTRKKGEKKGTVPFIPGGGRLLSEPRGLSSFLLPSKTRAPEGGDGACPSPGSGAFLVWPVGRVTCR